MKILVRPQLLSDHPFIFATYIRNKWFSKENKTTLKRSTWSALQHKRVEDILAKEKVLVACLDEDNDTILGYTFPDNKKPFTYVKHPFRSPGLKVQELLLKELAKI